MEEAGSARVHLDLASEGSQEHKAPFCSAADHNAPTLGPADASERDDSFRRLCRTVGEDLKGLYDIIVPRSRRTPQEVRVTGARKETHTAGIKGSARPSCARISPALTGGVRAP